MKVELLSSPSKVTIRNYVFKYQYFSVRIKKKWFGIVRERRKTPEIRYIIQPIQGKIGDQFSFAIELPNGNQQPAFTPKLGATSKTFEPTTHEGAVVIKDAFAPESTTGSKALAEAKKEALRQYNRVTARKEGYTPPSTPTEVRESGDGKPNKTYKNVTLKSPSQIIVKLKLSITRPN